LTRSRRRGRRGRRRRGKRRRSKRKRGKRKRGKRKRNGKREGKRERRRGGKRGSKRRRGRSEDSRRDNIMSFRRPAPLLPLQRQVLLRTHRSLLLCGQPLLLQILQFLGHPSIFRFSGRVAISVIITLLEERHEWQKQQT
jgi:hypothetical protein